MKIAYTHPAEDITHASAGLLVIAHGSPKSEIEKHLGMEPDTLSVEEYEKLIWKISVPKNAINPVRIADDAAEFDSPAFREFRNAIICVDGKLTHDLEKARALQLDKIRIARKPKLDALDVPFMKALETGDAAEQKRIVVEKQKLRDITESLKIMPLNSVDDIRKAFPSDLRD